MSVFKRSWDFQGVVETLSELNFHVLGVNVVSACYVQVLVEL